MVILQKKKQKNYEKGSSELITAMNAATDMHSMQIILKYFM